MLFVSGTLVWIVQPLRQLRDGLATMAAHVPALVVGRHNDVLAWNRTGHALLAPAQVVGRRDVGEEVHADLLRLLAEHPVNALWARFTGVKDWDSYEWRQRFPDYAGAARTSRSNLACGPWDISSLTSWLTCTIPLTRS